MGKIKEQHGTSTDERTLRLFGLSHIFRVLKIPYLIEELVCQYFDTFFEKGELSVCC
jgi:hypothetical protein